MMISVNDPVGRVWLISLRLFHRSRFPGRRRKRHKPSDAIDALNLVDVFNGGLAGVVVGLALVIAILALTEFWPIIIFAIELAVVAAVGLVHAMLGRRIVVAESDGEVWTWTVKGQRPSRRLAARVARAARDGAPWPPGGRFERTAPHQDA